MYVYTDFHTGYIFNLRFEISTEKNCHCKTMLEMLIVLLLAQK